MEIRKAKATEYDELKAFINLHWKKGHIFTQSKILFDFMYLSGDGTNYNIYIAKENDTVIAYLGYIPYANKHIWLSIWKTIAPGAGFQVYKRLMQDLKPDSVGSIGINEEVEKFYITEGYNTGILDHWYMANRYYKRNRGISNLRDLRMDYKEQDQDVIMIYPHNIKYADQRITNYSYKTREYLITRYMKHPMYNYNLFQFRTAHSDMSLMIRPIKIHGHGLILRIVDIFGNYENIANFLIYEQLQTLLQEYNAAYMDCLYNKFNDFFHNNGFRLRSKDEILPHYFEPFEKKNVDIRYAYWQKNPDQPYHIFIGDSDQDRPNSLIY